MTRDSLKGLLELIGTIAIVASLIFVALEIRTNTESNNIAIQQTYSSNWLEINSQLAGNGQLAEIVDKATKGSKLTGAEAEQLGAFVRMYLTQSFHMLRLFDQGLIPETEVRDAFRAVRLLANIEAVRLELQAISDPRRRGLILDEDGLDTWLDSD